MALKITNWITFGLALLFMLIKLSIVSAQQNESIEAFYGGYGNLSLEEIYRLFLIRQTFVEQLLILVSLSGYLIRQKIGFTVANIFPYFILGYGIFHLFESTQIFAGFHIGQITFAVSVIVLINTKQALKIFGVNYRTNQQLRANLISLSIAIVLILILLAWLRLNS